MPKTKTALYRHFNAEGQLLYVGIALSVVYRLAQHKVTSHWFENISRIDVEYFDDRESACDAEDRAIQSESPLFNRFRKAPRKKTNKERIPFDVPNGNILEIPVGTSYAEMERSLVLATLESFSGDKGKAAEALGICRKTLYNHLNRYRAA